MHWFAEQKAGRMMVNAPFCTDPQPSLTSVQQPTQVPP
jgi:hypothetical protein